MLDAVGRQEWRQLLFVSCFLHSVVQARGTRFWRALPRGLGPGSRGQGQRPGNALSPPGLGSDTRLAGAPSSNTSLVVKPRALLTRIRFLAASSAPAGAPQVWAHRLERAL